MKTLNRLLSIVFAAAAIVLGLRALKVIPVTVTKEVKVELVENFYIGQEVWFYSDWDESLTSGLLLGIEVSRGDIRGYKGEVTMYKVGIGYEDGCEFDEVDETQELCYKIVRGKGLIFATKQEFIDYISR